METNFFQKEDNLLTELGNWNSVEKLCAGVYGEQVLKDRSFQRMKLQEYQRLFNKYNRREHSGLDELALHKMLRYQSRKIEMHLYPNRLRRYLQRGVDRIAARIGRKPGVDAATLAFKTGNTPLHQVFNSVKENGNAVSQDQGQGQERQIQQRPEGWWIQNLGQKDKSITNDKKQGMGIH